MPDEKPLFIPLKKNFYRAFVEGDKTSELRRYGNRWNERTCRVGRAVTLSCGYSGDRISRKVNSFEKIPANHLPTADKIAVVACFGTLDIEIAKIGISEVQNA